MVWVKRILFLVAIGSGLISLAPILAALMLSVENLATNFVARIFIFLGQFRGLPSLFVCLGSIGLLVAIYRFAPTTKVKVSNPNPRKQSIPEPNIKKASSSPRKVNKFDPKTFKIAGFGLLELMLILVIFVLGAVAVNQYTGNDLNVTDVRTVTQEGSTTAQVSETQTENGSNTADTAVTLFIGVFLILVIIVGGFVFFYSRPRTTISNLVFTSPIGPPDKSVNPTITANLTFHRPPNLIFQYLSLRVRGLTEEDAQIGRNFQTVVTGEVATAVVACLVQAAEESVGVIRDPINYRGDLPQYRRALRAGANELLEKYGVVIDTLKIDIELPEGIKAEQDAAAAEGIQANTTIAVYKTTLVQLRAVLKDLGIDADVDAAWARQIWDDTTLRQTLLDALAITAKGGNPDSHTLIQFLVAQGLLKDNPGK